MATDEELLSLERAAIESVMEIAHRRDGFASTGSRETISAALRAVYNAGLDRAAVIARGLGYAEARAVAAAIEAEKGQNP